MLRRVATFLFLAILIGMSWNPCRAGAQVEVFINNKPFKGGLSGSPGDLMLEAAPYFKLAGGEFKFDAESGSATLDGSPVTVTMVGAVPYIRAKEMVSLVGGRYNANAALGTVDIYAFDPVEAARKAWQRIFAQPAILSENDFAIMGTLTRAILTRDLGLDLDFDVDMKLVTVEEIKARSGRDDIGSYSFYTYRPGSRTGIANATILVIKGMAPIQVINHLGGGWSQLWASRLGLPERDKLIGGFGIWTSYYVLTSLGAKLPASSFGTVQPEQDRQEFLRLVELQKTGGPQGVVNYMRNLKK